MMAAGCNVGMGSDNMAEDMVGVMRTGPFMERIRRRDGRNPTPEFRAARQARTLATGQVFGTPECPLTPLNVDWDLAFIQQMCQGRLAEVDDFDIEAISRAAGRSTHEIRTWVAAFAALAASGPYQARQDYYRPINQWIAGYGVVSAQAQ